MGRPTSDELQQAMAAAVVMREAGDDPDFLAKTVLNLNYRVQALERVLSLTRRYLRAGHSTSDHRALLKAIDAAESASHVPEGEQAPDFSRGRFV